MEEIKSSDLPLEIRTKLAELESELSEGDITEKGYHKKKAKILEPYLNPIKEQDAPIMRTQPCPPPHYRPLSQQVYPPPLPGHQGPLEGSGRRRDERRYTRDEPRYRSEIREEAVRQALSHNKNKRHDLLIPNKRSRDPSLQPCISPEEALREHQMMEQDSVSDEDDLDSRSSNQIPPGLNMISSTQVMDGSPKPSQRFSAAFSSSSNNSSSRQPHHHFNPLHQSSGSIATNDEEDDIEDNQSDIDAPTNHAYEQYDDHSNAVRNPPSNPSPRFDNHSNILSHNGGVGVWSGRNSGALFGNNGSNPNLGSSHSNNQSHRSSPLVTSSNVCPGREGSPMHQVIMAQQQNRLAGSGDRCTPSSDTQQVLPAGAYGEPPDVTHVSSALQCADLLISTGQPTPSSHPPRSLQNPDLQCSTIQSQTNQTTGSRSVSDGSLRSTLDGPLEEALVATRVSEKILQLVHTLKRPKRRPLPEYFQDDDATQVQTPAPDTNAPKPKGEISKPARGEDIGVPSALPLNLEAALKHFASVSPKSLVMSSLDDNRRLSDSLTYAKLYQRTTRIAYLLLNKLGRRGEQSLKPRDRVAIMYPNSDPAGFLTAFFGCIQAGLVPMAIDIPIIRRVLQGDPNCQNTGFLLNSQDIRVILTNELVFKTLPRSQTGEIVNFPGWPKVQIINCEHHATSSKPPRDWQPPERMRDDEAMYIESTYGKEGSVCGVIVSRKACIAHCRALTMACHYSESDKLVCVVDCRRETGLWHAILTSVFNGMHVIFVSYVIMKKDPSSWVRIVTKYKATSAIVKSRDMHWALLAEEDHASINLSSLKMLLVADGANPWSLTACDNFQTKFRSRGLRQEAMCPCASSVETQTISLRRPSVEQPPAPAPSAPPASEWNSPPPSYRTVTQNEGMACQRLGGTGRGRGVVSMQSLSHGVVRVDSEFSLSSLTLQDCGQVLPGGTVVVVKTTGPPYLCKTDEVGEICMCSDFTGSGYWGLSGRSTSSFKVVPLKPDGTPVNESQLYTRSGLLGFLGPVSSGGLVFICGSMEGMMSVSSRRHNADDVIATVLAVEPIKIVFRGRIAAFSTSLLKDERIVIVAELRSGYSEEDSFRWMSRVLQAIDSIHQVNVYCLALVPQNCLPKTPMGGIHVHETKRRFLEGCLHPCNLILCPHASITNLPQPRQIRHGEVGPSAMMVGNLVQGVRLACARGRDLPQDDDPDRKTQYLSDILQWRALNTPDSRLFTLVNQKMQETSFITCAQLHRRAEKIGSMILEKGKVSPGAHVALLFPPGIDFICAVYGCLYAGCAPVPVKPPYTESLESSMDSALMIVQSSRAAVLLANLNVIKLIKSKEAQSRIPLNKWPTLVVMDDTYRKKLTSIYKPMSSEHELAYLDFAVSTTGVLTGIKMSHATTSALCYSQKVQCEFYPSREVVLCLEPYSGLGFVLWCLSSVYCGHHSLLIPPHELDNNPGLWINLCSLKKVRDTFCSYASVELSTKALTNDIHNMKAKGLSLASLRSVIIVGEERPRIKLTADFTKLFSVLGLSGRSVSTAFGCRVNVVLCLQGVNSPETSAAYVDMVSLRNDRVKLMEKGSPHSVCLLESGKLLPGVRVVIANPETLGQCADSQMGEIWVSSPHNSSGYFIVYGGTEADQTNWTTAHFSARLATGDTETRYARTGYLGFVRRTELTQSDGERHDALFVVGSLDEAIMLRGMRYHPVDIENTILTRHKKISECTVFTWSNLLVAVVELDGSEWEAMDLIHPVTSGVLEEHYLIVGVLVVVDLGTIVINSRGMKQRMLLRDTFVNDKLDPIYVSYNM